MTPGKRTEFKPKASKSPRRLSVAAPKVYANHLFIARPIKLNGWALYKESYIRYVYRTRTVRPGDESYYTQLAAEKWKSMTDWEKADFEALVPHRDRFDYVVEKREFPLKAVHCQAHQTYRLKMDLADKMAGLRM